jgi:hypothetical protein
MPDAGEIMQEGVFGFGIRILGFGVWFFWFEDGILGFGVWNCEFESDWVAFVAFVGLERFRPLKGW